MTTPRLRATDASGKTLDDPSPDQVHDLFADLNLRWPFAIVERLDREPSGQHFFQIHLDYLDDPDPATDFEPEVDYDVEFRAGGPTRHYHARVSIRGFGGLDRVMEAYRAWNDDGPELMTVLPWELLAFDD
ncbi:hypothetical protein [Catenulispora subtropica]|uniref:Uncharacterized protein n=1 Tax=Catenulispora subtropica TaxID=450798 RepID=A0ABP5DMY3_9ACTN